MPMGITSVSGSDGSAGELTAERSETSTIKKPLLSTVFSDISGRSMPIQYMPALSAAIADSTTEADRAAMINRTKYMVFFFLAPSRSNIDIIRSLHTYRSSQDRRFGESSACLYCSKKFPIIHRVAQFIQNKIQNFSLIHVRDLSSQCPDLLQILFGNEKLLFPGP